MTGLTGLVSELEPELVEVLDEVTKETGVSKLVPVVGAEFAPEEPALGLELGLGSEDAELG